jgi:hypothetical protein
MEDVGPQGARDHPARELDELQKEPTAVLPCQVIHLERGPEMSGTCQSGGLSGLRLAV